MVLGRIIADTELADMYQVAFIAFFSLVEEHGGGGVKKIRWKHLHGSGFLGTTVDMCGKQMKGKIC